MKLLFERSRPGRGMEYLPPCDTPAADFAPDALRAAPPRLPEGYGLRCYRPGD